MKLFFKAVRSVNNTFNFFFKSILSPGPKSIWFWKAVARTFNNSVLIPSSNITFGSTSITPIRVFSIIKIPFVIIEIPWHAWANWNLSSIWEYSFKSFFNILFGISLNWLQNIVYILFINSKTLWGITCKISLTYLTNSPL